MAERWGKLSADFHEHPKAIAAGLLGRAVFVFAITRNAKGAHEGRIPRGFFGPNYLARQLDVTPEQAAQGLDAAVEAGLLALDERDVVMVGWDSVEWGSGKPSDRPEQVRERVQRHRDRKREGANDVTPPQGVGNACNAVTPEERRGEERIGESDQGFALHPPSPVRGKRKRPATTLPPDWKPNGSHRALAQEQRVDLNREAAKFTDWAAAKDQRYANWDAAFSNWLRNARSYGAPAAGPPAPSAAPAPVAVGQRDETGFVYGGKSEAKWQG